MTKNSLTPSINIRGARKHFFGMKNWFSGAEAKSANGMRRVRLCDKNHPGRGMTVTSEDMLSKEIRLSPHKLVKLMVPRA